MEEFIFNLDVCFHHNYVIYTLFKYFEDLIMIDLPAETRLTKNMLYSNVRAQNNLISYSFYCKILVKNNDTFTLMLYRYTRDYNRDLILNFTVNLESFFRDMRELDHIRNFKDYVEFFLIPKIRNMIIDELYETHICGNADFNSNHRYFCTKLTESIFTTNIHCFDDRHNNIPPPFRNINDILTKLLVKELETKWESYKSKVVRIIETVEKIVEKEIIVEKIVEKEKIVEVEKIVERVIQQNPCCTCLHDIANCVYSCGHVCICNVCAQQVEECPICRKGENPFQIFFT